ncbi:hypothetical protein [Runella sp.]|uniref:hypothetical protein n=1 Tax=Runella sp. TaxID=1960881 RepID=UPI003D1530C9
MQKLIWWAFTLRVALCDCHNERNNVGFLTGKGVYEMVKIGQLPPELRETSGLALGKEARTFWTHNDGDNPAELYEVNDTGKVKMVLKLPQFKNIDWEDLAQDNKGHLYIADLGNNTNQRKDLVIHKINPNELTSYEAIHVSYADQKAFPPPPDQRNFDCEATVWHQNKLYLFSKNRSTSNRLVKMYAIPDTAGTYKPSPIDSVYSKAMVTSADVSPDGKTLALLTYGKILFFDVSKGMNFRKPLYCLKFAQGQTEAILFINNDDFIITNEEKGEMFLGSKKNVN